MYPQTVGYGGESEHRPPEIENSPPNAVPLASKRRPWVRVSSGLVPGSPSTAAADDARLMLRCEADADGRIRELHTIPNPGKPTAIRFGDPPPAPA